MLIDDWLASSWFAEGDDFRDNIRLMALDSQRFVLSPQIVEAAYDLSKSTGAIQRSKSYLFTPAKLTWIEWAGNDLGFPDSNRHGLFLMGDAVLAQTGNLQTGTCGYLFDADQTRHSQSSLLLLYDFPGSGNVLTLPPKADFEGHGELVQASLQAAQTFDIDRLGRFLAAALALINTPRITLTRHLDHSKLNKARLKAHRPPLLSYKDVVINPDCGWVSKSQIRNMTDERRRHHVRSFLRLRYGRVELIGAHFRGNREKGYVLHRYVIKLGDEKFSGPPLPAPQIMPQGFMAPGDEP